MRTSISEHTATGAATTTGTLSLDEIPKPPLPRSAPVKDQHNSENAGFDVFSVAKSYTGLKLMAFVAFSLLVLILQFVILGRLSSMSSDLVFLKGAVSRANLGPANNSGAS
uniref:Uncharacterized protein n=1 Tax=Tetraselmis sp. GSL018 TaxID=582737 RepID=A0A061R0T9_9CHLO